MKRLFFAAICLVFWNIGAIAQTTETFDIATFQAPKGWDRKDGPDSIQFSTADKDNYCLVTLFRSVSALGNPKENFDGAWATIVREAVIASSTAQMLPADSKGEWQITGGFAPFEKDGVRGVALLITASGYGKMMNALVLTNTQAFEAATNAFLNSITFKKQEAVQANGGPVASALSVTSYTWKQSQNRRDIGGYAGYSSNTYQFFSNNTYKFSRVDFQNYAPKYYLENEEGTYKIIGNRITVTPRTAVYSSHRTKKEDPPLKTGDLGRSTLQYSFEIIDLNNNLTLLLSPTDGLETKRDGPFSFWFEGEKRKTYSYNSVNGNGELIRIR
jgi:hypothetical protein